MSFTRPHNKYTHRSRLIGLKADTLDFVWSTSLQGIVAGTPKIGSDAEHVYVTHNVGDKGMFTVLTISSGGGTLYFYSPPVSPGVGGFAPVGVSFTPIPDGNYANGFKNTNDFVSWSNMAPGGVVVSGTLPKGATHAFQLPRIGMQAQVQILTDTTWATRTPPTLSSDGQSMFYSVSAGNRRGNEIRAWPGKNFGAGSAYSGKGDFARAGADPPFTSVTLSTDESRLFYASTANALYGVNARNGNILWKDESLPGVVKTKPVVSPDGLYVYFLTVDGTICSKDVVTGTTQWTMKNGINPTATADFAIDEYGLNLYYAEADSGYTTYYELSVADFAPPTATPTRSFAPSVTTTEEPTIRITIEPPTLEPTPEFTLETPTTSETTMAPVAVAPGVDEAGTAPSSHASICRGRTALFGSALICLMLQVALVLV